jgi:hypothetical protein
MTMACRHFNDITRYSHQASSTDRMSIGSVGPRCNATWLVIFRHRPGALISLGNSPVYGELLFCQNATARCSLVRVPTAGRVSAHEGAIHTGGPSAGNLGQAHAAGRCPHCRRRIPVAQHQLLTLKRSSKRAPKLTPWDRLLLVSARRA